MKAVIVTIFVFLGTVSSSTLENLLRNEWTEYKLEHKKVYDTLDEEQYRYGVYLKNRELIAEHNKRYALDLETYTMGINHFSDQTYEEFLQQYTGHESR
jgi:Cathepsin propeptide inhibitor domain (I29)